jgi:Uma2 family endonuclease
MSITTRIIGPQDHGRRMSLAEFEPAEVQEGYLYELARGVIIVSDVPDQRHFLQVDELREQLSAYRRKQPQQIYVIGGGSDCKVLITSQESERHPDISVFKKAPPDVPNIWVNWIPEIVIEVVSSSSEYRDYVEKREDYLPAGVREYWIVDAGRQEVLVLRRVRGQWKEQMVRPPQVYRTRLLPGFELVCERVFQAAAGR